MLLRISGLNFLSPTNFSFFYEVEICQKGFVDAAQIKKATFAVIASPTEVK